MSDEGNAPVPVSESIPAEVQPAETESVVVQEPSVSAAAVPIPDAAEVVAEEVVPEPTAEPAVVVEEKTSGDERVLEVAGEKAGEKAPELPQAAPAPAPATPQASNNPSPLPAPIKKPTRGRMLEVVRARRAERLEKIVQLAREKRVITNDDVEKLLKVSDSTATRYLNALVLSARLKRSGSDGGAVYEPV